jgi:hypothetical protein
VVTLHQRGLAQLLPACLFVQSLGGLQGDLDVGALEGESEPKTYSRTFYSDPFDPWRPFLDKMDAKMDAYQL